MGQILLGDRHFERVAWGCDFQDHICLGWLILTTFLLGVLLGVDLLGAVRQGCSSGTSQLPPSVLPPCGDAKRDVHRHY